MKESTRNFATGIVSIIAFAGLAFLLLLFGDLDMVSTGTYRIVVEANDAIGLRAGSRVSLAGVPIGEVDGVVVRLDPQQPVRIVASIDNAVDIPAGVAATVATSLLGGTSRLDLVMPPDYAVGGMTLPHDGSAVLIANLEGLEAKFARVLSEKLGGMDAAMKAIEAAAKDAQRWLGDEQLLADARSAVWKANTLIEQATNALVAVTESAHAFQSDSKQLLASMQPVFDQLSKTLAQVELLTTDARKGQGTIGQLMSNPDLYNALVDSAKRLKATLAEVEILMQKVRAEGLGVKF
ncbi:MAG: MCE family protein [Phycisphaerales bacterium]|nr:MCE family protein [Phycisphaerales bacterium]